MAKYIDKEQIERVRLEDSCYIIEHHKGDEIDCIIDAPAADVIERSKIDKAIEEMESIKLVMSCEEMKDYCVEILKRNIGE